MKCDKCGEEDFLPFRCPYCGGRFCSAHRLPENHDCRGIGYARSPSKKASPIFNVETHLGSYGQPAQRRLRLNARFSREEIRHLAIASALVFGVGLSMGAYQGANFYGGWLMLLLFAFLVSASFMIHELAHKVAAQRRGVWAEFRLVAAGALVTALSMAWPFFKVIAPGAVFIAGINSYKELGEISLAGPIASLAISLILHALRPITWNPILSYGAAVNAWIALINLIPFGMLDGRKVFAWSRKAWLTFFALSLALTAAAYMV